MRAGSSLLSAYQPLWGVAPARRLIIASLAGRMATGAYPIPLILLVHSATHSYALAGAVEATNLAAAALTGPARGRALDRFGSRRVIPPMALGRATAIAVLWPVAHSRATWATLLVAAAAGVAAPALPTAMRLQWQRLLGRDDPRLVAAYAFESLAQVFLFVAGPLLAAAGIATLGPGVTLAATAGLLLSGALPFALFAVDDRAAPAARGQPRASLIRVAGVRTLVLATVAADAALGSIDIAVTAFAKQRGSASAAAVLLAIFCLASALGGAVHGARRWRGPPRRRLPALMGLAGLLYLPLAAASSLGELAGLLALAGAPFAAQWTASYLALDQVAPVHAGGEAMSWLSAANATGVGLGYVVAGAIVQAAGTTAAFLAASGLLALATLIVLAGQATLRATPGEKPTPRLPAVATRP